MKTETAGSQTPVEVLIPEARQHQRRRYQRSGVFFFIAALVVAALVVSAVLLFRGPAAGGKAQPDPKPIAAATTAGSVTFRPVLCFAAPYAPPTGGTVAPPGTGPIPFCSAASLLSNANLDVTPGAANSANGYSSNPAPADPQYASYPSTSVEKPGSTSSTVLLPGLNGACDGIRGVRCVLGPVVMTNRAIASAKVTKLYGNQWTVDYTTTSAGAVLWDRVTEQNFHQFLGIALDGVVYSAPIIQPTQSSFSSFDGRGEISGNLTHSEAVRLANALRPPKG